MRCHSCFIFVTLFHIFLSKNIYALVEKQQARCIVKKHVLKKNHGDLSGFFERYVHISFIIEIKTISIF